MKNNHHNAPGRDKTPSEDDRGFNPALLDRVDELQDYYDFSPVGYLSLDSKGRFLAVNLTTAVILGTFRSQLMNESLYDYVVWQDRDTLYLHLRNIFKDQWRAHCELRLQNKDHEMIHVALDGMYTEDRRGRNVCRSVMTDITDRKRSEQALRDSEERFRLMAETSPDIIFQLDPNGVILYCSPSVERILGHTPDEVEGTSIEKYLSPSDIPEARNRFQVLIAEKITFFEFDLFDKSGTPVPVEVSAAPVVRDGKISFIFGIGRDITERKKAEKALRRSREHLRMAVEGGGLGTWERDLITGRTVWNDLLYDILGRDVGRPITSETFFEYIHPDDLAGVREHLEKTFRNEDAFRDEFRIVREDGQVRWMAAFGRIQRDGTGQPIRMAGINFDITDRKHIERQLRESRDALEEKVRARAAQLIEINETLRAEVEKRGRYEEALRGSTQKILMESKRRRFLSARLVETLEKDRREVAMYLHDDIGQRLATLKMDLETVRKHSGGDNGPLTEKLREFEAKVAGIMSHVKDISRRLRPDMLDTLGLVPALRALVEGFRSDFGLQVHFYSREPSGKMDPEKSLALYRITQEALSNVGKHAQATEVFVNLIVKGDSFLLSVEDDGVGFPYHETVENSTGEGPLGLMIMRERAALAGGELSVESEIGKGTHVVAEIPIV
jgi:PAS domain S-box-containing protein